MEMVQDNARLYMPSPTVGFYRMGNVQWWLESKPTAWQRFWVRFTLGWTWEDKPNERR